MKNLYRVLSLICLFSTPVFAQDIPELRVVEMGKIQENEFVASVIRDANGQIAAGLIIESDLVGLAYESNNGIIKRDMKPGRDFLFLSPEERIVTVYKSGYRPLKIVLMDQNVRLRAGMVHKISITADKKLIEVPINIITDPIEAEIVLKDSVIKSGSTVKLLEGKYAIKISLEGYNPIADSISVSPDKTLFTYNLTRREFVPIQIVTLPEQATIFLSNENVGLSNLSLMRQTGEFPIRISKAGFSELVDTIRVESGKENIFSYSLITNAGLIHLKTVPSNAIVSLNKVDYSGKSQIYVQPGVYQLEIAKSGYEVYSEIIEIKRNEVINRDISLIAKKGSLRVTVAQKEAKVSIFQKDGDFSKAWEGDIEINELPAGRYTIALQLPNYFPIQETIVIRPDAPTFKYYDFTTDMLVDKPQAKINEAKRKVRNKDGFVAFYGAKTKLSFDNETYGEAVKSNTYFEGGISMVSDISMINLAFMNVKPDYANTLENQIGGREFAVFMGDINAKFDLFDVFHPYVGVGYMFSTLDNDLRNTLLNDGKTAPYSSAYYRYGVWFIIGEGPGTLLNFGLGYDVRNGFGSKDTFSTKGWMGSLVFKF